MRKRESDVDMATIGMCFPPTSISHMEYTFHSGLPDNICIVANYNSVSLKVKSTIELFHLFHHRNSEAVVPVIFRIDFGLLRTEDVRSRLMGRHPTKAHH